MTIGRESLAPDEIHVWHSRLDLPADEVEQLRRMLPARDMTYSPRLGTQDLVRRYVVSRGMLRVILARYTGIAEAGLSFAVGRHGKPRLTGGASDIHFNMSHSRDEAVYAIAFRREVGIDMEVLRPIPKAVALAERFFSRDEYDLLKRADAAQKDRLFLTMWVRREAHAKARGLTVWNGLEQLRIRDAANENASGRAATVWTTQDLRYAESYAGALVAGGEEWSIIYRSF